MDTTRAQQMALDDELEPTLQVVLDALKLTPFYNAFEISADVPKIYMQEFWVTVTRHHSSLRFKLNVGWKKVTTVMLTTLEICSKFAPKTLDRKVLLNQNFQQQPEEFVVDDVFEIANECA
ncbi:hypothetical protein Tco_0500134 [Tanacetum coccineum]